MSRRLASFVSVLLFFLILIGPRCLAQEKGNKGTPQQPPPNMVVGAIRWDAWHADRSEVGKAVQQSLSPEQWHGRLPFFAQVLGKDRVRIDGASQEVVDEEIKFARTAGLDYWAFLLYEEGSPMDLALKYYLASGHKGDLRFCLILEPAHWTTSESAAKQFEYVAELMARPEYQKVADGRPLLYLMAPEPDRRGWGAQQTRSALDQLRAAIRLKSGGNPYVVVQDYRPERANVLREHLYADAISAYAYQRDDRDAPYALLAQETEKFWDECRETGSAVVPIVMTGWDRRPRIERPVFWEPWQKPNVGIEKFYRAPTPAELSQHLRNAAAWVKAGPNVDPAKTILIYAWNENDEGGWLVPTFGDGRVRVNAVRRVLKSNE